jgi:hypothetical protein
MMLQAAIAAAVALSWPAGPAVGSKIVAAPPSRSCAVDIDPSFVRYVPPPVRVKGANPLWLLISNRDEVLPRSALGCVRPIQVRDER